MKVLNGFWFGRAALSALCMAAPLAALAQAPLGTAFTYQGRLNQAGQPYNGPADLLFDLYDAGVGGNLLGSHALNGVAVNGGLFTVVLDFGAGAFTSEARWLEVTVNGTPLSPRQPITAAPYALSLAPGATIYGGANGLNTLSLYHSDVYTSAIYALHTGTNGTALYGESDSGAGAKGVWGLSSEGIGVYGSSDTGAAGVQGANTTGDGVRGVSSGNDGIYGLTLAGADRAGVRGVSTSPTGGYGVFGSANRYVGYAVFAHGDMAADGTKPFRIDHPDDPANKYLLHYAAESPEVINFYRGTVVLDSAGAAVVELPHYFAKINKTPSYQLTAVGAPMPMLHVAEEIDEAALSAGVTAGPGETAPACSFRIAGGAPGAKVSWEVKALRNDLWVRNRAEPVEVEKQGLEKGTYQHPEFYGQPPERGMNYRPHDERPESEPPSLPTAPDAPPR